MTSVPLPLGKTHTGGEPLYRVMPAYPPTQRAACPALEQVEVAVRVDATGKVQDVIGGVVDMVLPPWNTFFAAVRPAVMQWRFEPLRVDHWAADANGNAHAVDSEAHRFEIRYLFDFTCRAGQTNVAVRTEVPAYPR